MAIVRKAWWLVVSRGNILHFEEGLHILQFQIATIANVYASTEDDDLY